MELIVLVTAFVDIAVGVLALSFAMFEIMDEFALVDFALDGNQCSFAVSIIVFEESGVEVKVWLDVQTIALPSIFTIHFQKLANIELCRSN